MNKSFHILLSLFLFVTPLYALKAEPLSPVLTTSALQDLKLPDVEIADVEIFESEGENSAPGIKVSHCKVSGLIGGNIGFELLLPDKWNGRFFMGGGGGYVGAVSNRALVTINEGYATAGTDTGHHGHGLLADWAYEDLESQLNFGYLAVHRTAEVSKAIIRAYYGQEAAFSYFDGASRGGGQALMEALRYPKDFDGIIAGCPAQDWSGFSAKMIQNMQAVYPDPTQLHNPVITEENLKLLEKLVLKSCDGIDGIVDGIIMDPRQCTFDLDSIPDCPEGEAGSDCFTSEQRDAIKVIYDPLINKEGQIYPGQPFGSEGEAMGWKNWIVGTNEAIFKLKPEGIPSYQFAFGTEYYKYFIFGDPNWDYSTYDFSSWKQDTKLTATFMDSTSTDLTEFKKNGGKLIIWHGWSDPALSAYRTIEYYEEVMKLDEDIQDFFRLYLMPGVLHGQGGPGPDQVDWRKIMVDWVEQGQAPEVVTATKFDQHRNIIMTRPLCPYPQSAVYHGSGDTNQANNFTCKYEEKQESLQ
jgi:Tannase and feruloyl esterase